MTFGNPLYHHLLDPCLQVGVGALQRTNLGEMAGGETSSESEVPHLSPTVPPTIAHPHLVQVAGQAVVQVLHGLLVIGAIAVHAVHWRHHWPIEVRANGGGPTQRAAGQEGDRGPGASAAGVHQGAAGEGGLAAGGVAPH